MSIPDEQIVEQLRKQYPDAQLIGDSYAMQILWVREDFARFFGYTPEEVIGKPVMRYLPEMTNREFFEITSSTKPGETRDVKMTILAADGSPVELVRTLTRIDIGSGVYWVGRGDFPGKK